MEGKRGGGLKILALDSSGLVASVALAEDDNLIAEYTVQYKKTHSQTLLPMLEEIVRMVEMDLSTVDAIAVAAGPGSFTGLRIGSATAKGLAFASGNRSFRCRRWMGSPFRCTVRKIWCVRLWTPEGVRYIREFMNLCLVKSVGSHMTCVLSGNSAQSLLTRLRKL